MIKKTDANRYGVVQYAVSTEDEVAQLSHLVAQGSTCIVIATANVYMFDESDLSWHSLTDGKVVVPNALAPKSRAIEVIPLSLDVEEAQEEVVVQDEVAMQPVVAKAQKKSKKSKKSK